MPAAWSPRPSKIKPIGGVSVKAGSGIERAESADG